MFNNAEEVHKAFHNLIWNGTEGTPEHINRLEALFEENARLKCIEQQKIAAEYAWEKWNPEEHATIEESILNSPLATDK